MQHTCQDCWNILSSFLLQGKKKEPIPVCSQSLPHWCTWCAGLYNASYQSVIRNKLHINYTHEHDIDFVTYWKLHEKLKPHNVGISTAFLMCWLIPFFSTQVLWIPLNRNPFLFFPGKLAFLRAGMAFLWAKLDEMWYTVLTVIKHCLKYVVFRVCFSGRSARVSKCGQYFVSINMYQLIAKVAVVE